MEEREFRRGHLGGIVKMRPGAVFVFTELGTTP
jgi:hypothetical protein